MQYTYKTHGTCSQQIEIDLDGDVITNVSFLGGCNGNLKGLAKLVQGMKIDDIIDRLDGITCGFKSTSCPDQLAQALKKIKEEKGE